MYTILLFIDYDASLSVSECANFDVRLTGGSSNNTGIVEICINQLWSSVCFQYFDKEDASVVCAALGFQRFGKYSHSKHHTCMMFCSILRRLNIVQLFLETLSIQDSKTLKM